jgi:hypothetical protein
VHFCSAIVDVKSHERNFRVFGLATDYHVLLWIEDTISRNKTRREQALIRKTRRRKAPFSCCSSPGRLGVQNSTQLIGQVGDCSLCEHSTEQSTKIKFKVGSSQGNSINRVLPPPSESPDGYLSPCLSLPRTTCLPLGVVLPTALRPITPCGRVGV